MQPHTNKIQKILLLGQLEDFLNAYIPDQQTRIAEIKAITEQALAHTETPPSENLATDFLLDFYLSERSPLPFHCHYGLLLANREKQQPLSSQQRLIRVVKAIWSIYLFYLDTIHDNLIKEIDRGVELEDKQYAEMFNTARSPHLEKDSIQNKKKTDENYIIVLKGGMCFKVTLNPFPDEAHNLAQIYDNLSKIHAQNTKGGSPLLFSTMDRTSWARVKSGLSENPKNKEAFDWLDNALFLVCLDDDLPATSHEALHIIRSSNYPNRYFDMPLQVISLKDGSIGFSFDHAIIDGHNGLFFAEQIARRMKTLFPDVENGTLEKNHLYPIDFHMDGWEGKIAHYTRELTEKVRNERAYTAFGIPKFETANLDLPVKSQDILFQLVLQLALYRTFQKFLVQNSSIRMRHFRKGRYEIIITSMGATRRWIEDVMAKKEISVQKESLIHAMLSHKEILVESKKGNTLLTGLQCISEYCKDEKLRVKFEKLFQDYPLSKLYDCDICTSFVGESEEVAGFSFNDFGENRLGYAYIIHNHAFQVYAMGQGRYAKDLKRIQSGIQSAYAEFTRFIQSEF
uniref:Choline/Carnitine o-acyltransferase n=1 Tax=Candidatus Kentrum sp. LPFa TaxID=2126335 RepID=A0A450VPT2_9GAMM|nr:MAG: Choline/Carnitine o-acyltransferase [Candidatus Kentron sp. LPFa]VFK33217.1 MAG: Choline/Carnitine o-acyltransferase [Candidatus Kentron sp. LPFa]